MTKATSKQSVALGITSVLLHLPLISKRQSDELKVGGKSPRRSTLFDPRRPTPTAAPPRGRNFAARVVVVCGRDDAAVVKHSHRRPPGRKSARRSVARSWRGSKTGATGLYSRRGATQGDSRQQKMFHGPIERISQVQADSAEEQKRGVYDIVRVLAHEW